MKTCSQCQQPKPLEAFYNRRSGQGRKDAECKECHNQRTKEYRQTNKLAIRQYYQKVHQARGLANKVVLFRRVHSQRDEQLTLENVIAKFGSTPQCYLTGVPIDLQQRDTYELDHILPISRGGNSSLLNCGLATRKANRAK